MVNSYEEKSERTTGENFY